MESFETKIQKLESELTSAQNQLGDHYEYGGDLGNKVDVIEEILDTQAARITTLEEETMEDFSTTEESVDCVRYGLMEFGGFVRNTFLTRDQRSHMFVQERANLVLWIMKHRAETADPPSWGNAEGGEEEAPTNDPEVHPESHDSPGRIQTLLEHMR